MGFVRRTPRPLAPEQPRLAEALGLVATGHDAINEATEKRLNDVAALWPVVAAVLLLGTAGLALALGLSGTATARTVGLEINANHLRPAMSGHVHATATAEMLGRSTQVWTIRIEDDAGKLICLSRMTAAVIDRR